MVTTMVGTTVLTHVVLRLLYGGPAAPRVLFSITCGVIAAGALAFYTLLP
jgi:hypothetical protein